MQPANQSLQTVADAVGRALSRARERLQHDIPSSSGTSTTRHGTHVNIAPRPTTSPLDDDVGVVETTESTHDSGSDFAPDAESLVEGVRRRFRRKRVGGDSQGVSSKKGRKKRLEWKTKLYLLQKANSRRTPTCMEQERLEVNGLGSPLHERPTLNGGRRKSVLKRHWTVQQLDSFIQQSYPNIPFGFLGFEYAFANKSRQITKIERHEIHSVADVEACVGQGKFYIIPNEDIRSNSERVPQPSIQLQPQINEEIGMEELPGPSEDVPLNQSVTQGRPETPASQVAQNEDEQPNQREDQNARILLIEEQNQAFEESLRNDAQRDVIQEAVAEAERRRLQTIQDRRSHLDEELASDSLLQICFPDGRRERRRFDLSGSIQAIFNFVGTFDSATENFTVHIAGSNTSIPSSAVGTCSSHGVNDRSSLLVTWLEEFQPTDSTPDFVPAATTVHHVSSESENELPEVMLSGTPSVTFLSSDNLNSQMNTDIDEAFNALDQCLSDETIDVAVRRNHVLVDVMNIYKENKEITSKRLNVKFEGEEGADFGGLTRDMFSMFWTEAGRLYFAGEGAMVPRVPLHKHRAMKGDYITLGAILSHTAALTHVVPSRLSRTFLTLVVFEDPPSEDYLLKDFLDFITVSERALLKRALRNFDALTPADKTKLIDVYSMYEMYETPSQSNINQQLVAIAESALIYKSKPFVEEMRKGMPPSHMAAFWSKLSLQMIDFIFVMQSPTGKKVADVLQSQGDLRPQEEAVLWWLKDFVSSLDAEDVADFLRFTTGSSVMPQDPIQVEFLSTARFPTVRTCANLIQCPVFYTSRNELKREWRAILSNSDSFQMSLL
ncbi:uncharacterized protein [Apostichopus japonicus]|uniref:uncharacterized protein isoform X1 n=1 Tax=Stichopus japonicus TaxID=307972 RepID=UPI003AB46579